MEIPVTLSPADIDRIADAVAARIGNQSSPPGGSEAGKILWREDEAADALGISPHTLKKFRLRGYVKAATANRPVLYTREQVQAAAAFLTTADGG